MPGRRSDGKRTRERILEIAIPLFATHGFAGTSIRMISTAADVNVATLSYHFGGKDGLYRTVVTRLHEDLQEAFPQEALLGPPETLLERVIGEVWAFCKTHREHNRLLVRHVLDMGALPEVVAEEWTDTLMDRGANFLRLFRPEWTNTQARMLINAVQHILVRWALEDPAELARILGHPEDLDASICAFVEDLVRLQLGLPARVASPGSSG